MRARLVNEKFIEKSDPIKDMGISKEGYYKNAIDTIIDIHHSPSVEDMENLEDYDDFTNKQIGKYILGTNIQKSAQLDFAKWKKIHGADANDALMMDSMMGANKDEDFKNLMKVLRNNGYDKQKALSTIHEVNTIMEEANKGMDMQSAAYDKVFQHFKEIRYPKPPRKPRVKKPKQLSMKFESVNEKFTEKSDPIEDMGISMSEDAYKTQTLVEEYDDISHELFSTKAELEKINDDWYANDDKSDVEWYYGRVVPARNKLGKKISVLENKWDKSRTKVYNHFNKLWRKGKGKDLQKGLDQIKDKSSVVNILRDELKKAKPGDNW